MGKPMNERSHTIFITQIEDGSFLAASIDSPRFCVGAPTERGAFEKAQRALAYYDGVEDKLRNIKPQETRVISPVYKEKELCA